MEPRPYELLVRLNPDGSIGGAMVRSIVTVNGRDVELDPVPLQSTDDPAFAGFAELFCAAVVAERDELQSQLNTTTAERDELQTLLTTRTAERNELQATLTTRSAEREEIQSTLETKLIELASVGSMRDSLQLNVTAIEAQLASALATLADTQSQLTTITNERDSIRGRVDQLVTQLPWDPRIIDASAFVARVGSWELLSLSVSEDTTHRQIAEMLGAYKKNDWPIMLDSPEMQQSIGYLVETGAITPERAAELLRDSLRSESYQAGN